MQNIITMPPPSDFEIDSFRLKIPLDKCKILSHELNTTYLTINAETSEIVNEKTNKGINVGSDYMKVYITIRTFNDRITSLEKNKKSMLLDRDKIKSVNVAPSQFLVITINSKLLRDKYLDRITWNNIELIYDRIMNYKASYCDYHTFVNSDVIDVDFCRNVQIPNWQECKSYILDNLKPTKKLDFGVHEFNRKDNIGLQFGIREKSSYTKPYIKIYHKYIELTTKSKLFAEQCLNDAKDVPKDLFRVEYTLNNRDHYRRYKLYKQGYGSQQIVASALSDMLSLSNEKKEYIASHMFSYQFDEGIYKIKSPRKKSITYSQGRNAMYEKLQVSTPKHLYLYMLLQSIKEYGDYDYNLSLIITELESVGFNKRTLQRAKKDVYSMFSRLSTKEQDNILDKENESKRMEIEYLQILESVKKSIEQIGINELHYKQKTGVNFS